MSTVVVFDADNTIWDTNEIFRDAQLSILKRLSKAGYLTNPDTHLTTLRALDTQLGNTLGRFEYNFELLPAALIDYFSEPTLSYVDSVRKTLSERTRTEKENAAIHHAFETFRSNIRKLPRLYDGTLRALTHLKRLSDSGFPIVTVLFTEGDAVRLGRTLQTHRIKENKLFDKIVIGAKNKESFQKIKEFGRKRLAQKFGAHATNEISYVMVGDNLERDVYFAKQAGFLTIYKPSNFKGLEKFRSKLRRPDYVLNEIGEVISVLANAGVIPDISPRRIVPSAAYSIRTRNRINRSLSAARHRHKSMPIVGRITMKASRKQRSAAEPPKVAERKSNG